MTSRDRLAATFYALFAVVAVMAGFMRSTEYGLWTFAAVCFVSALLLGYRREE